MELIITEKPQAAMKIAYALAEIVPVKRTIGNVSYYEVNRGNKKIIVACAVGHLFTLVQKEKGTYPVFEIEWKPSYVKKEAQYTKKYIDVIANLTKKANSFVIACDYDIEGELIGLNVLRFICKQQDAKRMKFSTLTKEDIVNSYEKILPTIDWSLAYAGETRHYLDWLYGINLSRALMQAIRRTGSFRILSIGRVQGPALALVVKREKEISDFVSKPYWQVSLLASNKEQVELKYPKNIFEKKEIEQFKQLEGKKAKAKTEKKKENMLPLVPFDLTTLQVEAYKFYNITPSQILKITQGLYLAGLISYPRTSSQKLPPSIGYDRIIKKLSKFYDVKERKRKNPIEGKKSDPAHPAIFPTGEKPTELAKEQKQIYELIIRRFLSCFAADAIIENKTISIVIDKKKFVAKGVIVLEQGWLEVYKIKIPEKKLPDINGEVIIRDVKLEEKATQPPKRYSPASLVSELTKRNLGTKGTRALIVDTLYRRGYIQDTQIKATGLGSTIVKALEKNCALILDEELTRNFEREMEAIQTSKKGKKEQERILKEAKVILKKIAEQFKKKEEEIGKELIEAHKETIKKEKEDRTIMLCPACKKGKLIIIKSKKTGKRFLACNAYPECKTTFSLPQNGLIKKADKICECGWPMLLLIKKGRRPWQFCFNPNCKNKQEKEKI